MKGLTVPITCPAEGNCAMSSQKELTKSWSSWRPGARKSSAKRAVALISTRSRSKSRLLPRTWKTTLRSSSPWSSLTSARFQRSRTTSSRATATSQKSTGNSSSKSSQRLRQKSMRKTRYTQRSPNESSSTTARQFMTVW